MSAIVTRYPTGVFGIACKGGMFWATGFNEQEIKEKLKAEKIPAKSVKWEERYYDGDYRIAANYKTRRYFPKPQRK